MTSSYRQRSKSKKSIAKRRASRNRLSRRRIVNPRTSTSPRKRKLRNYQMKVSARSVQGSHSLPTPTFPRKQSIQRMRKTIRHRGKLHSFEKHPYFKRKSHTRKRKVVRSQSPGQIWSGSKSPLHKSPVTLHVNPQTVRLLGPKKMKQLSKKRHLRLVFDK